MAGVGRDPCREADSILLEWEFPSITYTHGKLESQDQDNREWDFPPSSSTDLFAISQREVENRDRRGWKTRRKDSVSKGQGVVHQSPWQLLGLRGLQSTVRTATGLDSDTFPRLCITHPGWWSLLISAHSPAQPPWTCAFQAAVSAFLPERITHMHSHSPAINTRERFCLPAGPKALGPQVMKPRSSTQIPWKVDRAGPACASHPSAPNTPHLICTYLEKRKSMLGRGLDSKPLTSNHLKGTDSNLELLVAEWYAGIAPRFFTIYLRAIFKMDIFNTTFQINKLRQREGR